jgi:hypothetical protein
LAASTTLAAWELFDRELTTHDLVLADVRPKEERLRLDAGRLGPTGLYWALRVAGARRIIFSRRSLSNAATAAAPAGAPDRGTPREPSSGVSQSSASGAGPAAAGPGLPHPQEWATWLVIGPPAQPFQPPTQP